MLDRQFKNNAESLRSFFKDQIISDNTDIIPKGIASRIQNQALMQYQ